jgi:hypothetical protein
MAYVDFFLIFIFFQDVPAHSKHPFHLVARYAKKFPDSGTVQTP